MRKSVIATVFLALVSTVIQAEPFGKSITLSNDMMTAAATGTLSDQSWKILGLSVKWAEFYVGTSTEYAWSTAFDAYCSIPLGWSGWRFPTTAEVQELYYASNRQMNWMELCVKEPLSPVVHSLSELQTHTVIINIVMMIISPCA